MSSPSLTFIPRELRQHILTYTFQNALDKDLKLIACIRHSHYNIGGLFNGPWKPSPFYSPHIANLASLVIAGLPDLAEDVKFVIGKTLGV